MPSPKHNGGNFCCYMNNWIEISWTGSRFTSMSCLAQGYTRSLMTSTIPPPFPPWRPISRCGCHSCARSHNCKSTGLNYLKFGLNKLMVANNGPLLFRDIDLCVTLPIKNYVFGGQSNYCYARDLNNYIKASVKHHLWRIYGESDAKCCLSLNNEFICKEIQ